MVMHFPGKGHKVHKHATYHYDIAPTLMQDYLGCINKLEDYTIGKSLWENNKKPYFVAGSDQNYAVIENQQITTVVYGNYFVSTPDMKDLDNSNLNSSLVFKAMKDAYRFYNQL
jgi:membrane-anchored protein YejM (alkaline phosphatase superfamily)